RKWMLIAASLAGALSVGGALAYVYDGTGAATGSGEPPLITADQRPIKTTPTDPGGKTFPHKNKLIYDRLQGEEQAEKPERLVPRQEEVAATGAVPSAAPAQLSDSPDSGGQQV